ncbi:hypothetical protein [Mycobacterium attenuatum]|uniref:hypothetical protein n=1 Tax=Mycobacterium attenuatum TaxID=2341086 RepID=UPI001459FD80|nr:hypothetical protein [Mycobacterium attenuatum]
MTASRPASSKLANVKLRQLAEQVCRDFRTVNQPFSSSPQLGRLLRTAHRRHAAQTGKR